MEFYTKETLPFKYRRDLITFRELLKFYGNDLINFLETYRLEFSVSITTLSDTRMIVKFGNVMLELEYICDVLQADNTVTLLNSFSDTRLFTTMEVVNSL